MHVLAIVQSDELGSVVSVDFEYNGMMAISESGAWDWNLSVNSTEYVYEAAHSCPIHKSLLIDQAQQQHSAK